MYNITVTTEVWKNDKLWWDGGSMRWFNVNDEVKDWLAGSCKTTAFWLIGLPEVVSGDKYSIKYRTLVTKEGKVYSDTTMIEFPNLSYEDIIKFQRWALNELSEMIELFEKSHTGSSTTKKRSKFKAILNLVRQTCRT